MLIDLLIEAIKAIIVVVMVLNLAGVLLWFERKGSALIQDRIGANRASITGLGKRIGLPNLGFVNTLIADPLKLFTKEDFVPEGADKFLHGLAPFLALFPVIITFAVVPFGDMVQIGSRTITLQAGQCQRPPRSTSWRPSGSACTASRWADGPRTIAGRCSAASARPPR